MPRCPSQGVPLRKNGDGVLIHNLGQEQHRLDVVADLPSEILVATAVNHPGVQPRVAGGEGKDGGSRPPHRWILRKPAPNRRVSRKVVPHRRDSNQAALHWRVSRKVAMNWRGLRRPVAK